MQLALTWLLRQGDQIVPIPGITTSHGLAEIIEGERTEPSDGALEGIPSILENHPVVGDGYNTMHMGLINH